MLYQHAYVLQFVFHVLLRLEIKFKKGLFYQYDDQMTTQYVYHRTPNGKIEWTPNVIYYVTSKPSNALYDGRGQKARSNNDISIREPDN